MKKFCVQIFGTIPATMEVEATDSEAAEYKAWQEVQDILDFQAEEIEPGSECPPPPEAKERRK